MTNASSKATTIDEIIHQMDAIIQHCIAQNNKMGYFAVLYRGVTAQVKEKIKAGFFDDGKRMENLVIVFANRYLDAYYKFAKSEPTSKCWEVAFHAAGANNPIILQHLMLGMNAHINLDLSIATAEIAPKNQIGGVKNDFNIIMNILASMIDGVQDRLKIVSPSIKIIDWVGGRTDEHIAGFAINKARDLAWKTAEKLAYSTTAEKEKLITLHDEITAVIARGINNPPGLLLRTGLYLIRRREKLPTGQVIKVLLN